MKEKETTSLLDSEVIEKRHDDLNGKLIDLLIRTRSVADRIFGVEPQQDQKSTEQIKMQSFVERVSDKMNQSNALAQEINRELQRLEKF